MKIIAMLGAAALAVTSFAAMPADAQRHGWRDDHSGGRDWNDGRWDRGRGYDRGRGWDRGRRWGGHRGYGRSRVVCRIQRGYYGPVRRCFTVYR